MQRHRRQTRQLHPHAQVQFEAVHSVLEDIGVKGKPELLLLNKIDTEDGEYHANHWRTLHPGAIPISARTGAGLSEVIEAVIKFVRGHQVDVRLECNVTDGKLVNFIRTHTRVNEEQINDNTMIFDVTVGKQLLEQIKQNDQVTIRTPVEAEA